MTRRPVQLALPLDVPPLPAGVRSELKAQIVPGWAQRAACASTSVDPDWWHACLAHALAVGEPDGIWGGLDDAERTWVRVALAEGSAVAAVLGPVHGQAAA